MKSAALAALVFAGSLVVCAAAPAQTPSRTRVIMLGTGTPAADPDRFGAAVVVLVDNTPYLFDIGVGVVRRWAAAVRSQSLPLAPSSLRTAFVTHLHSDHTLGYPDLILSSWTLEDARHRPLEIYGPKGLKAMTDHLLAAYVEDIAVRTGGEGERADDTPPVVHVHEIAAGVVYRDSLVTVTAFPAHHGTWAQAFGYRVQTPDRVIVLSGDAGPPSEIPAQCQGCDILLHEGGFRLMAEANPYFLKFHTTTEDLARIATAARPKLLVLYHQPPAGPVPERGYAALRALYNGPFVVARDLDVYR
jgi:ribonuclease BN (tRNA processing enzyme)